MHIILLIITIFMVDGTSEVKVLKAPDFDTCQAEAVRLRHLPLPDGSVAGVDTRCIDIAPVKAV